jgi:hypothetical protein
MTKKADIRFSTVSGHFSPIEIVIFVVFTHVVERVAFYWMTIYIFDQFYELFCAQSGMLLLTSGHRVNFCGIINRSVNVIYTKTKRKLCIRTA